MTLSRRTPLYGTVTALGGHMIDRPGFLVAEYFSDPKHEHITTREAAGIFDIFGQFLVEVSGTDAEQLLQRLTVADIEQLRPGRVVYCSMLQQNGGIIDDLTVFRATDQKFWVVPTPSRVRVIEAHLKAEAAGSNLFIASLGYKYTSLSLQGPRSRDILSNLVEADISSEAIPYFSFITATVAGTSDVVVSRTGFTGELGFELFVPTEYAETLYLRLLADGGKYGLIPCGLAAMNTLRLEKKYLIYGRDLDDSITPVEAGLGWTIKLAKPEFAGRPVVEKQLSEGPARRMVLLALDSKVPPPGPGQQVQADGQAVGKITTSGVGHTIGRTLALALIDGAKARDAATVQLAGGPGQSFHNAEVHLRALYDPHGKRTSS